IGAITPDGNAVDSKHFQGKYLLMVFWSLKGSEGKDPFEPLRGIRREFARDKRLLILQVCTDGNEEGNWDAWSKRLLDEGTVDYGDGKMTRFMDDPQWWNCVEVSVEDPPSRRYGVTAGWESFLVGPDGKVLAVRVPVKELRDKVAKVLEK